MRFSKNVTIVRRCRTCELPSRVRQLLFAAAVQLRLFWSPRAVAPRSHPTYIPPAILSPSPTHGAP